MRIFLTLLLNKVLRCAVIWTCIRSTTQKNAIPLVFVPNKIEQEAILKTFIRQHANRFYFRRYLSSHECKEVRVPLEA